MMNHIYKLIFLVLSCCCSLNLLAQDIQDEKPKESADEQAPAEQVTDDINASPTDNDESTETRNIKDDNFVPTVQISEDLSVSFPVDI